MQDSHDSEHVGDLREFLRPISVRKWLITFIVVAATALTYVYTERKPDQYTASTQIFLEASQLDALLYGTAPGQQDDRSIVNQAALLDTRSVAKEVAEQLKLKGDPAALLASVAIVPRSGSDFIGITAAAGTATGAANLANAFARAFITLRAADVRTAIGSAVEATRKELDATNPTEENRGARETLQTRLRRLEVVSSLPSGTAKQVDRAIAPGIRTAPRPRQTALFAFAISLVFSILAAFGLERFDRRMRRVDQIRPAYHAPVLAALPRSSRPGDDTGGLELADEFREVVRGLRTNLQLAQVDDPIRTLLVTSALAGEGKSLLVRNLSLAYQEAGMRVAIIECDLRRPTMAQLMNVAPEPGLTDVLVGDCDLGGAVQAVAVRAASSTAIAVGAGGSANGQAHGLGHLTVLTAGDQPANPPTILGAQRMLNVLATASEHNDIVIIDSPPLLAVADTLPLLAMVDGTIIVARMGVTNRSAARRAVEIIDRVPGANVLGVVANDVPEADLGTAGYGYGYGYTPSQREL